MMKKSLHKDQDLILINLAQGGNVQGVQALYEKYFQAIYRFCFWQTGVSEDAEDLTQEVFVAMTQSLSQFRGESSFKNWLYQIAKNIIAQWIKKKTRVKQAPLFEQLADTPQWIDPENDIYKQQLVKKILSVLKPQEKKVITFRYLRNYSVAETAQKLKISVSNVKVMTHRVLIKLQKSLEKKPKV